eukprot:4150694-Amphidinium_carterae.1
MGRHVGRLYQADVRARMEEAERLRRRGKHEADTAASMGAPHEYSERWPSPGHGNGCFNSLLNVQVGSGRENWRNQPYSSSRGRPPLTP